MQYRSLILRSVAALDHKLKALSILGDIKKRKIRSRNWALAIKLLAVSPLICGAACTVFQNENVEHHYETVLADFSAIYPQGSQGRIDKIISMKSSSKKDQIRCL